MRIHVIAAGMALCLGACGAAHHERAAIPTNIEAPATSAPVAGRNPAVDGLKATLWMQRAEEYRASAAQAYALAALRLDEALADPAWTAAIEQPTAETGLPPAIIVDVDETVLDNSPYQAWLIANGETFSPESWSAWVEARAAQPVPGALELARRADAHGVTIFYVTNRSEESREATRENLKEVGFPVTDEQLLMKGQSGWTSSKTARRASIAKSHRIVLMLGDNLLDFLECETCDLAQRKQAAEQNQARWGTSWITIPNPSYGSWDSAAIQYEYRAPLGEQERRRIEALVTWEGPRDAP